MQDDLPRYLQLLWGHEPPGRRGPRPGRTIREIGEAAVALADRAGADAVTMKSVAAELGMTPMSLYRYVDSRDQLSAVMVDTAFGDPPRLPSGGWRPALEAWARAIAELCVRHPWLAPVALEDPPSTPHALAWTDAGLRALRSTPLPVAERLSSLLVVDGWVRAHVRMSLQFGMLGSVPRAGAPRQYGAVVAGFVDAERFPDLAPALPALADDDADFFESELTAGLGLILDGVEARIARATRRQRTGTRRSAG